MDFGKILRSNVVEGSRKHDQELDHRDSREKVLGKYSDGTRGSRKGSTTL